MTSFVIDDLPRRLDLTPEIGIANATLSQQIDLAAEKLFDGGGKIEVTVSIRPGGFVGEADDEINVALPRIEIAPCRRANTEPSHSGS